MTTIENAYERFLEERFPLPSEDQVSELEARIGVTLPDDYRRFVFKFNGGYFIEPEITPIGDGCPEATLQTLFGINTSHRDAELGEPGTLVLFEDNDPLLFLPIGRTGTGGLIILDTAPGEGRGAIYLKKEYGDFYYLVDDIEAFFALLREPTWGG